MKVLNLLRSSGKVNRIRSLLEIRFNRVFWGQRPETALGFGDALASLPSGLRDILESGEADEAVSHVRGLFDQFTIENGGALPLPALFNADKSFAILVYSLARYLKPDIVLESGVGYGITSALVLLALEQNGQGLLYSVDLPSLADPDGTYTGMVIPLPLRKRWQLHLGSSRKLLPKLSKKIANLSLFISDSANVFTLQRYEFAQAFPVLVPGGVMIFNNISLRFQEYLEGIEGITVITIWQMEKHGCVTALVVKS